MTNPKVGIGLGGPSPTSRLQLASLLERLFPGLPLAEQQRLFIERFGGRRAGITETTTIKFSRTVPAATRQTETRRIGFDGFLRDVFLHFPPGPSNLVEVRLLKRKRRSEVQIVPKEFDTFIALDNTILPLTQLGIPVDAGDELICEWNNYDSTYPHTVPVICTVQAG